MKIVNDTCVYVQRNDIKYLKSSNLDVPESVFIKIGDGGNKYDFIRFDGDREIEFFKGLDWLVDYNMVKDLDEDQITTMIQNVVFEKSYIAKKFKELSLEEKKMNSDMYRQYNFLLYKMYILDDILLFKQGQLPIKLPEEEKNDSKKLFKRK